MDPNNQVCRECVRASGKEYTPSTSAKKSSGDWVVLIPDEKSKRKLEKIANITSRTIGDQMVTPYAASKMHLSLSSPLNGCLSKRDASQLLHAISNQAPRQIPGMDLDMENKTRRTGGDGACFQFSGINYQPYITVTTGVVADQHSALSQLKGKVNGAVQELGLSDPTIPQKNRRPHISVGQVNEDYRVRVHKTFTRCADGGKMHWNNHDRVLKAIAGEMGVRQSITFSEIALLRVIREEGQPLKYVKVGFINLTGGSRRVTVFDTPQLSYSSERPALNAIKTESTSSTSTEPQRSDRSELTLNAIENKTESSSSTSTEPQRSNRNELLDEYSPICGLVSAPPPKRAVEALKRFRKLNEDSLLISQGYSYYGLREKDGQYVIRDKDAHIGDTTYWTGESLNRYHKEECGGFDFAEALSMPRKAQKKERDGYWYEGMTDKEFYAQFENR